MFFAVPSVQLQVSLSDWAACFAAPTMVLQVARAKQPPPTSVPDSLAASLCAMSTSTLSTSHFLLRACRQHPAARYTCGMKGPGGQVWHHTAALLLLQACCWCLYVTSGS